MSNEQMEMLQKMKDAGFVIEHTEQDTGKTYSTFLINSSGEFLGDLLIQNGFVAISEIESGRTWIEYEKDGIRFIGHRKIGEHEGTQTAYFIHG